MATLQLAPQMTPETLEKVLIGGDLSTLTPAQRLDYLRAVCESVHLNPLTHPLEFLELDGRTVLYATKNCTDQLRAYWHITTRIVSRGPDADGQTYSVVAEARMPNGRTEESIGSVPLVKELGEWKTGDKGKRYFTPNGSFQKISPEARCNAYMKAETKARRRATLSISSLGGIMDESELDTLPRATAMGDPTAEERLRKAGRSAQLLIGQLVELKGEIVRLCEHDRPYYEVLAEHGYRDEEDVRPRKVSQTHELIRALSAKLDAIREEANRQPPEGI